MTDYEAAIAGGSNAAVIADLAAQAMGVVATEGDAHVVITPSGAQATVVDLEEHSFAPRRARGTACLKSVEAFCDYVMRHKTDRTTIWAEPLEGRVVAVLNDHGAEQSAEWGDLRADLILTPTPEWEHWAKRDGIYGSQRDFAEHIEDGLDEIRDPAGADLLEIAQTFQATVQAAFRSATRLRDGTIAIQWDEHVDARAGEAGQIEIPQVMELGLAPFYGETPYAVTARIRYRVGAEGLAIGYKLERPEAVVRDCLTAIRERITSDFPGVVFVGVPAGPVTPRGRRTY